MKASRQKLITILMATRGRLVKVVRTGTKNGTVITWMDPVTNKYVFRWDENPNYKNGPHYHINGIENHFIPGIDCVPQEYAERYFPYN